jgi:ubiquinone/menaquinone biosynthesis C-methylase UbiE
VVIAFVLHEADDPAALLREAVRLLRPDGEVAVVESPKIEGTPGPPIEHRIGEDELAALAARVGLSASPVEQRGARYYVLRLRRVRQ